MLKANVLMMTNYKFSLKEIENVMSIDVHDNHIEIKNEKGVYHVRKKSVVKITLV